MVTSSPQELRALLLRWDQGAGRASAAETKPSAASMAEAMREISRVVYCVLCALFSFGLFGLDNVGMRQSLALGRVAFRAQL